MFVWPNGSVTGSVHWGQLAELVASRDDESITEDGWAALDALLAGRVEGPDPDGDDEGAQWSDPYASETVANLRVLLSARELPTSGNKAELVARLHEADQADAAADEDDDDDTQEE